MRLDVGETGQAKNLDIGDSFRFVDGNDKKDHLITNDHGSHFEYDGRPNKRLSKDTLVVRVGKPNEGESKDKLVVMFDKACRDLEREGDVSAWLVSLNDVISRAITLGMDDLMRSFDKLERTSTASFSRSKGKRGSLAVDSLSVSDRKQWFAVKEEVRSQIQEFVVIESFRAAIRSILSGKG